jgi:hypothetical protein
MTMTRSGDNARLQGRSGCFGMIDKLPDEYADFARIEKIELIFCNGLAVS